MRSTILIAALTATIVGAATARAADESGEREKVKSELLMPECSWSKMDKSEYDECQKKRRTMKVMTPKERAQYIEHLEGTSAVVDEDGRRRAIATTLPARGRR